MILDVAVDDEPSGLFRKGFQRLNVAPKTKVLGHFHEWIVALELMDLCEVLDRRGQQLKSTLIKPFQLEAKESGSFETESLVFSSISLMSYVFEPTVTALVSLKGAIGELSDQVSYVKGSLVVLGANNLEGCYQV